MLIRLLGTLVQGSNQSGSKQVTHPSKGVFLMAKYCIYTDVFYYFLFLETLPLISLE